MSNQQELKRLAAEKAVEQVKDGMILGLGTGSTTLFALKKISVLIAEGKLNNIKGIPTSVQTERAAVELGIPLTDLGEYPEIDLTIDGADEVDSKLNLIKGGGGALLREKVIAQASKKEIIIVDNSKVSKKLGEKWHVPVEILPFAIGSERKWLESIANSVKLREYEESKYFITDEQNLILDCNFGEIDNPAELATKLNERAGIVEHGLFINLASEVIVAAGDEIKTMVKS